MIKNVSLGEEVLIMTRNKVGLLADIATMLANQSVNVEAASGYEIDGTASLRLVTNANLGIVAELRAKKYKSVKETEVVLVELSNKPGALKVVTTELGKNKIDIKCLYVTSSSKGGESSRMVLSTSDNEKAMALLASFIE
ncbi:MAG: hypothetical protein NTZ95_06270 [Candidatus Omnitrophica bacterium]|nr:hypothetical protein [Candidatus Omnitrophota bacterium]